MSYALGEAAILTRIQAHASFNSNNSARNDWDIIGSGKSSFYAIVTPGEDTPSPEFITPTIYIIPWITKVEVWKRYKAGDDEITLANDLFSKVNAIIGQVQAQRQLGRTDIQNSEIIGISAPQAMRAPSQSPGTDPEWLRQDIIIQWTEQVGPVSYV